MGPKIRFIALYACASLLCAPAAHAQRATITVAPMPGAVAGSAVALQWSVTNTGTSSRSFGVGAELRRGSTVLADLGGQVTPAIAPGATASGAFAYLLPAWWFGGIHVARAAVWSAEPGASKWLDGFDRDFTVEQVPIAMQGRIAYHAYSDYLATPVSADDGHIFVRSLPSGPRRNVTGGLPVENAMNPHLSTDGSRVTFMAIPRDAVPPGAPRDYDNLSRYLEIYVYDLARDSLVQITNNDVADEDGKFSPDGRRVVFKRAGQIWAMNADGSGAVALTSTGPERSGPSFSPDGASIVYWEDDDALADVWRMALNGSGPTRLVGAGGLQEYHPVYRDSQTLLFSRWESPTDHHDDVYAYSLAGGTSQRLPLDMSGVEDADAFPIDAAFVGFSSTRRGESYDLYVGSPSTGVVFPLGTPDDALQELGGSYSPLAHARALTLTSPGAATAPVAGSPVVVSIAAYSDGDPWTGASPRLVLDGPTHVEFTGLRDDGIDVDRLAGDGIYSGVLTVPTQPGSYQAHAEALSIEGAITQELRSAAVAVTVTGVTAVARLGDVEPGRFQLDRNYPNPFRARTSIEFSLPRAAVTSLTIYDARGTHVETLVDRELPAGRYQVRWDGSRLPSGAYFYHLRSRGQSATRKLLLVR